MLVGCTTSDEPYLTTEELAEQKGCEIMDAIMSNNEDTIKGFLCQAIKDEHRNLDEEIHELYQFINGDIVTFDEPIGSPSGGTTTAEDGWVERRVSGDIRHIKTTTIKEYNIHYVLYLINKEHPELLGISRIYVVVDGAEHDPVAGYAPEDWRVIELE